MSTIDDRDDDDFVLALEPSDTADALIRALDDVARRIEAEDNSHDATKNPTLENA